ncbi:uncharacterized protein LOC131669250 [Phymastichus coffea]|uniref:uncharacterized protein LOC131669249 n=1 Tax=Phymastichus coffea TaxID=108790 RepID=UPI00273CE3E6|nr:uncharacterized protein LOC131669249 [Phymastichus coffea]XP_058799991.1 uncharacterized protein LOC131669250 [Phymastichus coffea]
MYDSHTDEDYNSDRILVFATRENLRLLFSSTIWFLDGTFDTVPSIFFQLFTIMGSVTQTYKGTERKIAIPLVYALLENKKEIAYSKVIEVTLSAAEEAGIRIRHPQIVMTDFELAIINAVKNHFGENIIRLCFFHLRQSIYRKIQSEGLQQQYGDPNDNSIREAAHSMCALAYVPPDNVPEIFDLFQNEMPEEFIPIATYFEINYVRGIRAIGRRKAVRVRYAPALWNQYNSVLQGVARTNNASEGWHNRFQILVGRRHPSLYSFLTEIQKEQADVEYMSREISLGKKVKKLPKSSQLRAEERIAAVVAAYQSYVDEENELEYLKIIGHHLNT